MMSGRTLGKNVDLKLNHSLIDPNFDSYKLSLERPPLYKKNIQNGPDVAQLNSDEQYSLQHVKAFALPNHLIADPWNPNSVYYVDDQWNIMKIMVTSETAIEGATSMLQIPNARDHRLAPNRHNVSLHFAGPDWAVVADGTGFLHIVYTDDRKSSDSSISWKVRHSSPDTEKLQSFIVLHSVLYTRNQDHVIECLLLHVEERFDNDNQTYKKPFYTILEWLTFSSEDRSSWTLERTRRLEGQATPDWAGIEANGAAVQIAVEKPFKMIYDSLKPIEEPVVKEQNEEQQLPAYTFTQTLEDITVQFTIPENKNKADVIYKLKHNHVSLEIKNSGVLLQGDLHAHVDAEASTWTLNGQRLDLFLSKQEEGSWPLVVKGDTRGERVIDEEEASVIHQRLAHLTSDNMNADPDEDMMKPYNAQQLEDCDAFPDDTATLQRLDGDSHQITHQVHLSSHQWLFNSQLEPGKLPALCLRHDVDGIIWQSNETVIDGVSPWEHVGTFNAFGYVQASKRDKKFSMCSPDLSYAVICDCVRHVYIYKQPAALLAPLRNRKTGREVGAVAKQFVVSLESTETIMGLQATNSRLFVMTNKELHIVKVNSE